MIRYKAVVAGSNPMPYHYYTKQSGQHHCNNPVCEWFYDGRTSRRAIKPLWVAPSIKGITMTTETAEEYIAAIQLRLDLSRSKRAGV